MSEFRAILRPKPGSLLDEGVVDYRGEIHARGPCFIPSNVLTLRRSALIRALNEAGWRTTPAKDWPSILPKEGLICIHRTQPE